MANPPPYSETDTPPGTPRWVKVFGIIALVIVLLLVVMMFVGGGNHGPSRHMPSADAGRKMPPSILTEDHRLPEVVRW